MYEIKLSTSLTYVEHMYVGCYSEFFKIKQENAILKRFMEFLRKTAFIG